ncbi:PREDICTED: uncharacterized protein LOC104767677 [Camelina sativa]|uniref:Uncharacterized protein LOC104767677 n=1 Tax=Camelina sativa TaxID=90675 RepID=A0ABM0XRQ5_CAMSA|nr:PREDICTED: uncharacterized protein LOC104767677 [Camelina sativa]
MMMKRILYCGRQALTRTKVLQSPRGLTLFPPPVLGATRGADHRRLSSESRRRGACIQSFSISPTQMTDSRRRMSYYPSDEEDDKDYLLFKNLLDVPCEFLAKETKSFMDLISCDPSLLEEEGSVSKIINCVVVPTLLMESEDEELFETDYRRFISWETDSESRRKAYNLFEQIFTSCEKARVISLKEVVNLLDSRDWMEVEAGVKLAASMVRCSSVVLVDAKGFTMMWILPLLHRDDSPMVVKASALCFLASAAHQGRVTTSWRGGIVSASFKLLNDQSMGVQSYACICLEELFKDNDCSSGHGEALVNLYVAFRKSQYNPYILRSIYQILLFCGISDEERLIHLLDMFEDLVSCPITEDHGFHVLREVIQKLDYSDLDVSFLGLPRN